MKPNLFARPNLKCLLLGALLLTGVDQWMGRPDSSHSDAERSAAELRRDGSLSEAQMNRLLDQAVKQPSAQKFYVLSEAFRKRGDFKRAMVYLRKAGVAEEVEAAQN